jgi:hypothetical protein
MMVAQLTNTVSVQRCGLIKPILGEAGIDKNLATARASFMRCPDPLRLTSTRLIGPFFLRTAHVDLENSRFTVICAQR